VVLSRKVSVLLMALVVVAMALGLMSVLRAVSASPDKEEPNKGEGRTLTVLTKNRQAEVVDLGPQGASQGDIRVANAPLYDAKGTERIGRFDLFCAVTDPADESAEKHHMAECTYTFTLAGGEISVQGLNAFPELPGLPPEGVDAISGGTGKYAGVEGELRHKTRANKVISTFHFID
jgi:hypothetical protein